MRSFSLFALAAAALAPFVAARPLSLVNTDIKGNEVEARAIAIPSIPSVPSVPGLETLGQKGCQEILIDLKVDLDVHITELSECSLESCDL